YPIHVTLIPPLAPFLLHSPRHHPDLPSFPTRRSSDLGNRDAVICGKAFIKGRPMMMAVMDPTFMMGSMGSVVGEKITRTIEAARSEEHTSELQSLRHLVCRLLLEKKKQKPSAARSHRL